MPICRRCEGNKIVDGALCPSCGGVGQFAHVPQAPPEPPAFQPQPAAMTQNQVEAAQFIQHLTSLVLNGAPTEEVHRQIKMRVSDAMQANAILEAVIEAVQSGAMPEVPQQQPLPPQPQAFEPQALAPLTPPPPVPPLMPVSPVGDPSVEPYPGAWSRPDTGPGVTARSYSEKLEASIIENGIEGVDDRLIEDTIAAGLADLARSHRPNVRSQALKGLQQLRNQRRKANGRAQSAQDKMAAATAAATPTAPTAAPAPGDQSR